MPSPWRESKKPAHDSLIPKYSTLFMFSPFTFLERQSRSVSVAKNQFLQTLRNSTTIKARHRIHGGVEPPAPPAGLSRHSFFSYPNTSMLEGHNFCVTFFCNMVVRTLMCFSFGYHEDGKPQRNYPHHNMSDAYRKHGVVIGKGVKY